MNSPTDEHPETADQSPDTGPGDESAPAADQLSDAEGAGLEGDLENFRVLEGPDQDPAAAAGGMVQDPEAECQKLTAGAFGVVSVGLRIFSRRVEGMNEIQLSNEEQKQLGDAWGSFLNHFIEIQYGGPKRDGLRALAETGEVGNRKWNEATNGTGT